MHPPRVVAVSEGSPAAAGGLMVDDELLALNGESPRDVIQYQALTDEAELEIDVRRGGLTISVEIGKAPGEPLGVEVHSALFDQVRTCDNHCEFCFIYQLPPGMRETLYLKDDDYRLSFLYGNFTTLTRFTELDLERVVTEGISPLNVSIHATDPDVRSEMLRNRRGGPSLRWLGALLDHDIEVHGQVVVCPGVNDGSVLEDTLCTILEQFPRLRSVCVVPLGVSRHHSEARLREHTRAEAEAVLSSVHHWKQIYLARLGRRLVHAADEYYLLASEPFPDAEEYEDFTMHEDGVGIAKTFEMEFRGLTDSAKNPAQGFFSWVEGAPPEGYRAPRVLGAQGQTAVGLRPRGTAPVAVLTGQYGAGILGPLLDEIERDDVRVIPVPNRFFGGNVAVAGLMVGEDIAAVLAEQPHGQRYLLPDVCLSKGQFLDGTVPEQLPRPVEIVPTDGIALRAALGASK
ncbi:MAG: DUF512 domain-containing protein [Acidimicrobiales bacterium]